MNWVVIHRGKMYWKYLKYVLEHKKNVGIECLKMGLFLHAITHDLSKFRLSEFVPYARFFYSKDRYNSYKKSDEDDPNFEKGWNHHQKRNKHHWNYWVSITEEYGPVPIEMPMKYVKQMIADWNGMSRKFGGSTKDYFGKNRERMILHPKTIERITIALSR